MVKTDKISCQDCIARLDMAISDVLDGNSIQSKYPAIFYHLQSCKNCSQAFNQMLAEQDQESIERFMQDPGNAMIITSERNSLEIFPAPPSPWTKIKCVISGMQIKAVITVPPPAGTRSGNKLGELEWLLFVDQVTHQPANIVLQLSLKSSWFGPEQLSLLADISSDSPLPQPLTAKLEWGQISQVVNVDETGQARFDALPPSLGYSPISDLSLELNVGIFIDSSPTS
ncbi:MAG: hypothetical protein JXA42_17195 [Anaerolineales bacterium]|nr:hypothetical protein [Anaerolineales bacterium]